MTEKRYTVGDELRVVDDNVLKGTFYVCIDRAEALKVADKLNEFHNENIRLNRENEQLKKQEKRLYKYFRKCFNNVSERGFRETWEVVKKYD